MGIGQRASVKGGIRRLTAKQEACSRGRSPLRGQALDVDGRSIQYNILKREADTNRQLYDSLLQRLGSGRGGRRAANNVSSSIARKSHGGSSPTCSPTLPSAYCSAVLLGVLVALLLEFLDDPETPVDVEQKLRAGGAGRHPGSWA